ncbi:cytochrome P450 [Melanogaster broomeanus]|nr:cytochrome P450 [Melanogaster broomeanus]
MRDQAASGFSLVTSLLLSRVDGAGWSSDYHPQYSSSEAFTSQTHHAIPSPTSPDRISGLSYRLVGLVTATAFIIAKLSKRVQNTVFLTPEDMNNHVHSLTSWTQFRQLDPVPGWDQHKAAPFKVANLNRWMVIVSGRQFLEDICKSRDDELPPLETINDVNNAAVLAELAFLRQGYQQILNTQFEEILDLERQWGSDWKSILALDTVRKVICRTANRVLVGLPLCGNPDWVHLNVLFTVDLVKAGVIFGLSPRILAPLVARCLTGVARSIRRGMMHLHPVIEERQKYLEKYGNRNSFLLRLMEEAEGSDRNIKSLTWRLLSVNFGATSSNNFTQALYNLAANPQYMQSLREEVESIVESDGWSKGALAKMRKIDSFLKESQRMVGSFLLTMFRRAMKDFTFSDGTVIPKGTSLAFATQSTHLANEHYENTDVFDPFRFSNIRDERTERVSSTNSQPAPPELSISPAGRALASGKIRRAYICGNPMGGSNFGALGLGGSTRIPSVPRVVNLDALFAGSSEEGTEARCIQSLHAGSRRVILQLHTVNSETSAPPPVVVVGRAHPDMCNLGRA